MKKIRLRRIFRLIHGTTAGDHTTKKQTSSGLEFDSLRQYEQGDDIRRIDWNSSLRTGSLMVRTFREQFNRTIILCIDISPSTHSGSSEQLKSHIIHSIADALIFGAQAQRDIVGACFMYNDQVVEYIPPRSGNGHTSRCLKRLEELTNNQYSAPPQSGRLPSFPKNSWLILITDGLVSSYESCWRMLAARHAVTLVRVRDRYERDIPSWCITYGKDPETGHGRFLAPASFQEHAHTWYAKQFAYAQKLKISHVDVIAGEPYEELICNFFGQGA